MREIDAQILINVARDLQFNFLPVTVKTTSGGLKFT
jgi:hypothetical protein